MAVGAPSLCDKSGLGVLVGVAWAFGTQLPPAANCRLPCGGLVGCSGGPPGGGNGRPIRVAGGYGGRFWGSGSRGPGAVVSLFFLPLSCQQSARSGQMSESWWELPDPPDAKAKSGDERAVTRRREKLMVNADVKLLVREALDPIETGLIKMRALMKQVRDERDNARAKVEELEHEGRLAAKTINHLTYVNKIQGEHMEELKRWHAAAKKENKEYLEEFGRDCSLCF